MCQPIDNPKPPRVVRIDTPRGSIGRRAAFVMPIKECRKQLDAKLLWNVSPRQTGLPTGDRPVCRRDGFAALVFASRITLQSWY